MHFGSLFTGIGGFDLALERAGMVCDWQVEIDKNCQKLLAHRFPNARRYTDVRDVGKHNLSAVDVICGGFPCQDLSVAGKRVGLAGERSGLWYEFARIIDEMRPGIVIIENVPGLLSSAKGADFGIIVSTLDEFGYGVAWRVLDAQHFGLAQRRKRMFIISSLGSGRAAEILFEPESVCWDSAQSREAGNASSASADRGIADATRITGAIQERDYKGIATTVDNKLVWDFHRQDGSYREQKGTMPTVAAKWGTGGNNMPFVGVRRLTPTECERLQGFPDGWTDGFADSTRYRMLGNAVAVPVVEWIARRIAALEAV